MIIIKTYMEYVAKILGVDLFEEFKIEVGNKKLEPKFLFTLEGLKTLNKDGNITDDLLLVELLKGNVKIIKFPFCPRLNQSYFSILKKDFISSMVNRGRMQDYSLISVGNCYETYAEAQEHLDEWNRKIDSFFAWKNNEL